MQCFVISEVQSKQLTSAVILYQQRTDDFPLHDKVHKATQRLLYYLPRYLHLLPEEECCEFLFYCYDTIEHYLRSYKEGNLSYVGYLTQVVRKRSRYYITLKRTQNAKEQVLLESEQIDWESENAQASSVSETSTYTAFSSIHSVHPQEMPSLFNQLLQIPDHSEANTPINDAVQLSLQKKLRNPVNRKRFLIMLAISPQLTNYHLLEEISALLGVEVPLLNRFLCTAEIQLEQKRACKQKLEQTSHRHYRRLMEIQAELNKCADKEQQAKLRDLQNWTERVYKAKIEQIRGLEYHLSHSQISRLLDIPKGTVASSVHYIKRLLKECMDES
ncbi:MAG: hypothetical protein PHO09_05315 [Sphaerochaeta sp.]|nr:hypothetical protein [Sphaerochaeta sp.]